MPNDQTSSAGVDPGGGNGVGGEQAKPSEGQQEQKEAAKKKSSPWRVSSVVEVNRC